MTNVYKSITNAFQARNHIQTLFPTTRYDKPTPPRRPRGILYKISNIHWHFINLGTVVLLNVSQDLDVITLHKIYRNTLQTMIGPITSGNIYYIGQTRVNGQKNMQLNGFKEYYDHETVENLSKLFECKTKFFMSKLN